jgi:hypothetical protein
MEITINDVKNIFNQLISGVITREEADEWAYKLTEDEDANNLVYNPASKEDLIWDAISYLHGIDMQTAPGEYMYSIEDIKAHYEANWQDK